jgi:hypothetical protein
MKTDEKGSHLTSLNAKHLRAIDALLREPTVVAAARVSGIGETTMFRWLKDPLFDATYKQLRARLLEGTLTALQSASVEAVSCLLEVIRDQAAQPSARVTAAKTVLEFSVKAREILEVEERLAYLENCLDLKNGRKKAA